MNRLSDLPAEFGTTMQAAGTVAKLITRAERDSYFDRIPAHYQPVVMTLAVQMIAANIVAVPHIADRRLALTRVPEDWLDDVKSHVVRLWKQAALKARAAEATA